MPASASALPSRGPDRDRAAGRPWSWSVWSGRESCRPARVRRTTALHREAPRGSATAASPERRSPEGPLSGPHSIAAVTTLGLSSLLPLPLPSSKVLQSNWDFNRLVASEGKRSRSGARACDDRLDRREVRLHRQTVRPHRSLERDRVGLRIELQDRLAP